MLLRTITSVLLLLLLLWQNWERNLLPAIQGWVSVVHLITDIVIIFSDDQSTCFQKVSVSCPSTVVVHLSIFFVPFPDYFFAARGCPNGQCYTPSIIRFAADVTCPCLFSGFNYFHNVHDFSLVPHPLVSFSVFISDVDRVSFHVAFPFFKCVCVCVCVCVLINLFATQMYASCYNQTVTSPAGSYSTGKYS